MKKKSLTVLFINIIGSLFLVLNQKGHFFDEVWDYFFAITIFILNVYEFTKLLKEIKNEKNIK